jgi:protein-tyrosine phosphatase
MMKKKLREAGIKNVTVSSAGTASADGARLSDGAALAAIQLGFSPTGFASRALTQRRVRRADLILTMAPAQSEEILRRWPDARDKTFVICDFSRSPRDVIEDPIGGSDDAYITCARALRDEIRRIVPRIKRVLRAGRRKG